MRRRLGASGYMLKLKARDLGHMNARVRRSGETDYQAEQFFVQFATLRPISSLVEVERNGTEPYLLEVNQGFDIIGTEA